MLDGPTKTILVLEDEMLIGLDLETSLVDAGFRVTLARSCLEAEDFLADHQPDLAVLDVRLSDGECVVAARMLVEHGVPFIVHTGMLQAAQDPIFMLGTPVTKPAETPAIVDLARSILARA